MGFEGVAPADLGYAGWRLSWGALQRCLSERKLHPLFMSGPTRLPALFYDGLSPQLSMGRPKGYWVGFEGVASGHKLKDEHVTRHPTAHMYVMHTCNFVNM